MNNGGSNKDRTKGKKMYRTSPPQRSEFVFEET